MSSCDVGEFKPGDWFFREGDCTFFLFMGHRQNFLQFDAYYSKTLRVLWGVENPVRMYLASLPVECRLATEKEILALLGTL